MDKSRPKLHVLVDSREPSVSFARYFYSCSEYALGEVEHIREIAFADRFERLLRRCSLQDELLISVCYLSKEQLERASSLFRSSRYAQYRITLAACDSFGHMREWCSVTGCRFLPNQYKKRTHPKSFTDNKSIKRQNEHLERIWVQYRLMLAIISRTVSLGEVCRQLMLGNAAFGDTIGKEQARALRYFELGEPDMAGGSYSCEQTQETNSIDELRLRINKIAATDFNILIKGESGSGKEAVAWSIHELSSRRDSPFLIINCAGIPDELLESEMFGYRKGSHNQAYEDAPGLLDSADGGTLFLDELPDMSPRIQAKLLRFMESGEYRPLGGTENRYSDTRIIAAGQPARLDAADGVRPDLQSRIGQLDVEIMPLREVEMRSPGTIYKIAFILLERFVWTTIFYENETRELTPKDIKQFQLALASPHNLELLSRNQWKDSNVRELNNFLRKWIVFGDGEFKHLKSPSLTQGATCGESLTPIFYDEKLHEFLMKPKDRKELKELFAKKPLHNLKKSYVRHLFEIYSKVIEQENKNLDMPQKATQKELATLMGVTENTISRHLN